MEEEAVSGPVVAHECWNEGEAAVIVSCLRAHGIEASMSSEPVRAIYPLTVDGIGRIQILVRACDLNAASFILKERAAFSTEGGEPVG